MSDYGLPDFGGQDLGIDLDKGIFVRKGINNGKSLKGDNDSNDSGNNSMNTNGSGKGKIKLWSIYLFIYLLYF